MEVEPSEQVLNCNPQYYNPHYHPVKNTIYSFQNIECLRKHCKHEGADNNLTLLPKELYRFFEFPSLEQVSTFDPRLFSQDATNHCLQGPFAICFSHLDKDIQNYIKANYEWPDCADLTQFSKIFWGKNNSSKLFPIKQSCLRKENQDLLKSLCNQTLSIKKSNTSNAFKTAIKIKKKANVGNPETNMKKKKLSKFEDLITIAPDSGPSAPPSQTQIFTSSSNVVQVMDFNGYSNPINAEDFNFEGLSSADLVGNSSAALEVVQLSDNTLSTETSVITSSSQNQEYLSFVEELESLQSSSSVNNTSQNGAVPSTSSYFQPNLNSTLVEPDLDQLPQFAKFVQEIAVVSHSVFEVDKPSISEFNYFGKLETILYHPEKWSELELIQTAQKFAANLSHGQINWCDSYENSDKYILSGAFGEMRISTDNPKLVITKKTNSLSSLLELEIIYKTSSFHSSTNSLAGYLFLPTSVYCDKIITVHVYKLQEVCSTVAVMLQNNLLTDSKINFIVREICKGLDFLHAKQIIHRDICPNNIFIFNNKIQIGNLSFAIIETFVNNGVSQFNTKMPQCSPEQIGIKTKKSTKPLTTKVDIWSLGCLYAYLLTKFPNSPFSYDQNFNCYEDFQKYTFKVPEILISPNQKFFFQPSVFDFLKRCLMFEGTHRPTAVQLKQHQAIKHFSNLF